MRYFMGALLTANILFMFYIGILMTDHEIRIRHMNENQMIIRAELVICADKVKNAVNDVLDEACQRCGP